MHLWKHHRSQKCFMSAQMQNDSPLGRGAVKTFKTGFCQREECAGGEWSHRSTQVEHALRARFRLQIPSCDGSGSFRFNQIQFFHSSKGAGP
jgi:hypothetical protein